MGDWHDSLRHAWKALKREHTPTPAASTKSHMAERRSPDQNLRAGPPEAKIAVTISNSQSRDIARTPSPVASKPKAADASSVGRAQKRLPDRLSSSGSLRISVGVDLGTSSTKVCVRERGKSPDEVATFACRLPDEGGFLCPSLVALRGGRLYFGCRAETESDQPASLTFPHLKVCLTCEAEAGGHKLSDCTSCSNEGQCSGVFSQPPLTGRSLKASDLAICFLAWVMGSIGNSLPSELMQGQAGDPRLTFNVGVPVRYLDEEPRLKKAYWRVVSHASRLARGMTQGIDLQTVRNWVDQLDAQGLPTEQELPVQLKTEAEAAIVSWLMSPEFLPGPYCLIDIGAWTTDVSLFRKESGPKMATLAAIAFLSADTYRLAVNEVDEWALRGLQELWPPEWTVDPPIHLRRVRLTRENDAWIKEQFEVNRRRRRGLSPSVLQFARECVAERLTFRFHETLIAGRFKHDVSDWGGFQIFVGGGGAAESALWEEIPRNSGEKVRHIDKAPTAGLAGSISDQTRARLLVAAGLAVPLELWPDLIPPSQVPVVPKMPKKNLPTSEQLGYDK